MGVDAVAGTRRPLVGAARFAVALRDAKLVSVDASHIYLEDVDETAAVGPGQLRIAFWGMWMTLDLATYRLTDVKPLAAAAPPRLAAVDADARSQWPSIPRPSRLFVVNHLAQPVKLDLVESDGSREPLADKAFHDVCWHDLGDCGLDDRVAWIRAAAAKHPEMDLSRGVGVEGGSFGGYAAVRALEAHGEFYNVAVVPGRVLRPAAVQAGPCRAVGGVAGRPLVRRRVCRRRRRPHQGPTAANQ